MSRYKEMIIRWESDDIPSIAYAKPMEELVRCRECKWHSMIDKVHMCGVFAQEIKADDFCSYGEKPNADQRIQSVESVESTQTERSSE